jgi:hypothetical protein
MKSSQSRAFFALLLSVSMGPTARGQAVQPSAQKEMSAEPVAEESAPQEPKEMPASPPKVTCKGDQLSIAAKGSTLASILTAVRDCIGAKIDIPDGAGMSRFFDTLGPGPVRQVLTSLLDATDFNYVIGASDSDHEKVETVVLMARVETAGQESTVDRALTPNRRAFLQMRQNYLTAGVPDENSSSTPSPDPSPAAPATEQQPPAPDPNANQATPTDQPPIRGLSNTNVQQDQNSVGPQADPPPTPSQPSSVEDQIKNMQQLFQQRQQMIANQKH